LLSLRRWNGRPRQKSQHSVQGLPVGLVREGWLYRMLRVQGWHGRHGFQPQDSVQGLRRWNIRGSGQNTVHGVR
jgi:hypothetical protein